MTPDELRELRRAAFGRTSTPEEQRSAALRLAEIDAERARIERERVARADAERRLEEHVAATPESAPGDVPPGAAAAASRVEAGADRPAERGIRPLWLVPIVLAALAVGAVAGSLSATPRETPLASASPAAVDDVAAAGAVNAGDLHAADVVFARERTENDVYPHGELVPELVPSSVRYLGGVEGSVEVWVGKKPDDSLCLLVTEGEQGAATCATRDQFRENAIALGINAYGISWDGLHTSITPPSAYLN